MRQPRERNYPPRFPYRLWISGRDQPLGVLHEDFNLLLFDFRYLGKSDGSYSSAGAKEVEDLLAAIRFLKGRGIKKVGVWGFSMGGAVALMAIEKAPEIRAVISEPSIARLGQRLF